MADTLLAFTSLVSVLGGLVFGYELAVISGALLQLQREFALSCFQQEALVSMLLIGALLASLLGGVLMDHCGRRGSILLSSLLVLAGSLLLALGRSNPILAAGRVTVGFAISLSSMSCCIFVSELVRPARRGLMVTLYEAGVTVGIVAAYAINYMLADVLHGWRYMFGLAVVPASVQFVSIFFLPAKPGAYAMGEVKFSTAGEGEVALETMQSTPPPHGKCAELFQDEDNMRSRMVIGLGLVLFQQFTGQPNVLFYASTVFRSAGFRGDASALLASIGLGLVKLVATLISMVSTDWLGRRALLIGGCLAMTVSLTALGLFSQDVPHGQTSNSSLKELQESTALRQNISQKDTVVGAPPHLYIPTSLLHGHPKPGSPGSSTTLPPAPVEVQHHEVLNWIILVSMMIYVCAYSMGFGPMTWLVLSEIFPARVRGRAFALANCFNWAANLIVTFSFLNLIDAFGLSWTFFLYALVGAMAVVFIFVMVPETKGKSLEDIDKELSKNGTHNMSTGCCGLMGRTSTARYARLQTERVL